MDSSLVWFVLVEVLGHPDVWLYDGGWQEYGNLPDAVVARPQGPDPKTGRCVGVLQGPASDGR